MTIREVAKECGLSVSAVSQVLNGKEVGIPQKTKEKVRAAAEKLRYRPNAAARSLVTSRSDTVGVLVPDISNAFFGEAFKEIQRRMGEEGFDVLLCSGDGTAKTGRALFALFAARGADGLIRRPRRGNAGRKKRRKVRRSVGGDQDSVHFFRPLSRTTVRARVGGSSGGRVRGGAMPVEKRPYEDRLYRGTCGARRRAAAAGRLLRRARGSRDKTARDKRAIYGGRGRTRGESAVRQGPDRAVRLR